MQLDEARVARLATADAAGKPHVVPVTFAYRDNTVVIAVDHKPKTTRNLKRLRNITDNDQVSLLVDHYEDDWSRLWWIRVDGTARIAERTEAVAWLIEKYPQYQANPPAGPFILVQVGTIRMWP